MKSKLLGALALMSLVGVLYVMQTTPENPTADAAVGTIDALNVGTCLTTSEDVFGDEGCELADESKDWEVREEVIEVSTLYATYAHDPKTASDEPRAILTDSDLLKVSIHDSGRDKRTGVLIKGASYGLTNVDTASVTNIRDDLEDEDLDVPVTTGDAVMFTAGITVYERSVASTESSKVISSGSATLNFKRSASELFPAMDIDGSIRFYGCEVNDTSPIVNVCPNDGVVLLNDISVDEDASQGNNEGQLAPWLVVLANVPSGKDLLIAAIYYETSAQEDLVGGRTPPTSANETEKHVVFTEDEKGDNEPLLVRVVSDGDVTAQHLHLTETDRFTGRYEGFVRLTDANGDGSSSTSTSRNDWGLQVKDATSASESNAAVIGVESGPVTIEYRDSDGRTRTLRIEIDREPPVIQIDGPQNGSSSDDHTPDFFGTIEDNDAGLAQDSFRLVVDNQADEGAHDNTGFIVDQPDADEVKGPTGGGNVTHLGEYTGYAIQQVFGVVGASMLYDLEKEACSDQDQCHITSDSYDDGDNAATFDDSIRMNLQDSGGDAETRDREFAIDFQAYVLDMAGNIGFSDSDVSNPRFINDLGEDTDDRNEPNVLGYYSAHIINLDEKDPEVITAESATGYYGKNADGDPIANRAGIMVEFDGPIADDSVATNTFTVTNEDGGAESVIDVNVDGNTVFLLLSSELASDAEPEIDIAEGEHVEDMAGNETFGKELDAFDINDGISPVLTVTLSNGSGSGSGDEGPTKLTNDTIDIHIASDEALQGSPRIVVVCSSLAWKHGTGTSATDHDIEDYVANRTGAFQNAPTESPTQTRQDATSGSGFDLYSYTCGYDYNGNNISKDPHTPLEVTALSRPGENWEYTWKNPTGDASRLEDGSVTVVAFAQDRSRWMLGDDNVRNWASASTEFTYDTTLLSPLSDAGGEIQPEDGMKVNEIRPFILLDFAEGTTVTLDSVELDGNEVASDFQQPDSNRFTYWPESWNQGDHEVEVMATDAAGNEVSFDFEFEVTARGSFVLNLLAGWNAVSVPMDPIETSIGAVFTDPAVETVIGWDTQGWRIAIRRDGVWESNESYGALNEIQARYGYWVKSNGFIRQPVMLKGTVARTGEGAPRLIDIPTEDGWNFVGVIDQRGRQTEDHFGRTLIDDDSNPVVASDYLGVNYIRAYNWDATFSRFNVIRPDDTMTIGDGVWVYYSSGTSIAP